MSRVVRRHCSGRTYDVIAQTTGSAAATKRGATIIICVYFTCVTNDGTHESLVMIVTSFALRSQCWWQLQCEMYVLQFCLNFFSVVLAQLRLMLRCRCVDASPSTSPRLSTFTSWHARIPRSTSPPHHTHTSAHLYHICTSTLSLLDFCPVFLSFFLSFLLHIILSPLYIYIVARSHQRIYLPTSIHLQIYIAPAHPHCHSFTSTLSFSLSIHLFDSAGQSHVSLSGQPSSTVVTMFYMFLMLFVFATSLHHFKCFATTSGLQNEWVQWAAPGRPKCARGDAEWTRFLIVVVTF